MLLQIHSSCMCSKAVSVYKFTVLERMLVGYATRNKYRVLMLAQSPVVIKSAFRIF